MTPPVRITAVLMSLVVMSGVSQAQEATSAEGFSARKGALHLPVVTGKVAYRFGTRPAPGARGDVRHTGWTIHAKKGRRVRAVERGTIAVAEPVRGYGITVIVDHGHGYHSVYAHLRKAVVSSGDTVGWGEIIGIIGSTGTLEGEKLYFELRHRGRPIDPAGWFASKSTMRRRKRPR
jgi:septal ring factor EnvC (AmiA/AmiB activator)